MASIPEYLGLKSESEPISLVLPALTILALNSFSQTGHLYVLSKDSQPP